MRILRLILLSIAVASIAACASAHSWHFTVTADQRGYDEVFDQLLVQMIAKVGGQGAFQVSPGDIDPPAANRYRIDARMGPTAVWYPGIGNHEEETVDDMAWLRREYSTGYSGRRPLKDYTLANGPAGTVETTYSWDYGSVHCVMLNEYWDGGTAPGCDVATNGDIVPQLHAWLAADLAATKKPIIIVFGHEPAFPQNRHIGDSLDAHPENRDAFWSLLESDERVKAYICGHTHVYSKYRRPGGRVWQIDVGNAGNNTSGDGSTFLDVVVSDTQVQFNVWRDPSRSGTFLLADAITTAVMGGSPVPVATPSEAKNHPDGVLVELSAVVSAAFRDFFYVQDTNRTSGIRVNMVGHSLQAGASVTIAGEMKTTLDGERCIDSPVVAGIGASTVKPVGTCMGLQKVPTEP